MTLAQVLWATRTGKAFVATETAAYLALELCEALMRQGVRVDEQGCEVTLEGALLLPPAVSSASTPPSHFVGQVLGALLPADSSSPLRRLASSAASLSLPALQESLESALVPLNRAAATRAVARLARDTWKACSRGQERSLISPAKVAEPVRLPSFEAKAPPSADPEEDLFRDLPAMDGLFAASTSATHVPAAPPAEPEPTPPPQRAVYSSPSGASDVDDLLERFAVEGARKERELSRDLKRVAGLDPTPPPPPSGGIPSPLPEPEKVPFVASHSHPPPLRESSGPPKARPTRALWVGLLLGLGSAAAAVAFWRGGAGAPTLAASSNTSNSSTQPNAETPRCRATLLVTDVPAGAEVLLRVGKAPLDVERLPVGARLEFVALAEGYVPRRGVIPAGAGWESSAGKPRFELAIQLEKGRGKSPESWPASEPGTSVGFGDKPGVVHIVTSPAGADVWMVAGEGPEARVEELVCATPVDVLVAPSKGNIARKMLHASGAQMSPAADAGSARARLSYR